MSGSLPPFAPPPMDPSNPYNMPMMGQRVSNSQMISCSRAATLGDQFSRWSSSCLEPFSVRCALIRISLLPPGPTPGRHAPGHVPEPPPSSQVHVSTEKSTWDASPARDGNDGQQQSLRSVGASPSQHGWWWADDAAGRHAPQHEPRGPEDAQPTQQRPAPAAECTDQGLSHVVSQHDATRGPHQYSPGEETHRCHVGLSQSWQPCRTAGWDGRIPN